MKTCHEILAEKAFGSCCSWCPSNNATTPSTSTTAVLCNRPFFMKNGYTSLFCKLLFTRLVHEVMICSCVYIISILIKGSKNNPFFFHFSTHGYEGSLHCRIHPAAISFDSKIDRQLRDITIIMAHR